MSYKNNKVINLIDNFHYNIMESNCPRSEIWSKKEIDVHEKLLLNFREHVRNLWTDFLAKKAGLDVIYIKSAFTETMGLRAEKFPDKRNIMNPKYIDFVKLIDTYADNLEKIYSDKSKGKTFSKDDILQSYNDIKIFVENFIERPCVIYVWTNYLPDPRCLFVVDDCLSYLSTVINRL